MSNVKALGVLRASIKAGFRNLCLSHTAAKVGKLPIQANLKRLSKLNSPGLKFTRLVHKLESYSNRFRRSAMALGEGRRAPPANAGEVE